ncbi:MAG TPA: VWA domain-containing protein, partial [Pirellulales bacterium]|nr:VWA domain-containing protein [Pirellulales bacterium]
KAFRAVQRSALAQMKSKKEDVRSAVFEKLKAFPTTECAKLLVQQGLISKFADVRKEAYSTLASFHDSDEVCGYLLSSVEKEMTRGTAGETAFALFAVPLSSDVAEIEKKAFDLFDKTAGQRKGGMLFVVALVDQLGVLAGETSVAVLVKISERPLFEKQFGVRRAVVRALAKIEEKSAVEALVAILGKVPGEVRGDLVQHLTSISGEQFGLDPPAWKKWWKANKDKFEFPAGAARVVNRAEAVQSRSMYYGLPIYAARLVFVIDTSKSMRGLRIQAAKRELASAINALPEGVYFDVLAFDRTVKPWQPELAIASAENKKKATYWVGAIADTHLGGGTASYDALEAALDCDTESIYFLTDGAPVGGKVVDPPVIVEAVSRLNFTRRITINALGIGVGPQFVTNPFYLFLSTLAERNYGEYKSVDH